MIIVEQGKTDYHAIDTRTKFDIHQVMVDGRLFYGVIASIPVIEGHDNGGDYLMAYYTDIAQAETVVVSCMTLQNMKSILIYQFPPDMPGECIDRLFRHHIYEENKLYEKW